MMNYEEKNGLHHALHTTSSPIPPSAFSLQPLFHIVQCSSRRKLSFWNLRPAGRAASMARKRPSNFRVASRRADESRAPGRFTTAKRIVPHLLGETVGDSSCLRSGNGLHLVGLLADLGHHVGTAPVEADLGRLFLDLLGADKCGKPECHAVEVRMDGGNSLAARSLFLISSHWASTSPLVSAVVSPKTWGWRRINLAFALAARVSRLRASGARSDLRLHEDIDGAGSPSSANVGRCAPLDRIGHLVGLLKERWDKRRGGLLTVPRTSTRRAEPGNRFPELVDCAAHSPDQRSSRRIMARRAFSKGLRAPEASRAWLIPLRAIFFGAGRPAVAPATKPIHRASATRYLPFPWRCVRQLRSRPLVHHGESRFCGFFQGSCHENPLSKSGSPKPALRRRRMASDEVASRTTILAT